MTAKYFHGKKENSTTYAAASFLMPGAAARVEAIRAKKRKLRHASPPPSAPEAPPAAPAREPVKAPSQAPAPTAEVSEEQQAKEPVVDTSAIANSEEGHKSQADAIETKSTKAISTNPVVEEAPSFTEQHEEMEAAVVRVESVQDNLDKPSLLETAKTPIIIPALSEYAKGTTNSPASSAPEVAKVEPPIEAGGCKAVKETGPSEYLMDPDHEQFETADLTSTDDLEAIQYEEIEEFNHSTGDKDVPDHVPAPSEPPEPNEEAINAKEIVHDPNEEQLPSPSEGMSSDPTTTTETYATNDSVIEDKPVIEEPASTGKAALAQAQEEEQVSSRVENLPSETSTPTKPSVVKDDTPIDDEATTECINPAQSDTAYDQVRPKPIPTAASHANVERRDDDDDLPPSSPSAPSRRSVNTSEVEWIKRHQFD